MTKNQHYVPQFLLRRFSLEERGEYRCNVYDLKQCAIRERQNIKKIFSRNYMYGKENIVESFLQRNIEDPVASEIADILNNPTATQKLPGIDLLRFICVQLGRTQEACERALEFINEFSVMIFAELARLNGFDVEVAKKLRLIPSDPSTIVAHQSLESALNWRLIKDLQCHIVVNKTANEFIISDHPVFQYNWYLRKSDEMSCTSIASRGVQLFLPLSPMVTYCLYDSTVYKYGCSRNGYSEVTSEDDIDIMNAFQVVNALSMVVFRTPAIRSKVRRLADKYGVVSAFRNHAACREAREYEDGQLKSLHAVWRTHEILPQMPSFIKIKNKIRRRVVACTERAPEVVAAVSAFKSQLRRNR